NRSMRRSASRRKERTSAGRAAPPPGRFRSFRGIRQPYCEWAVGPPGSPRRRAAGSQQALADGAEFAQLGAPPEFTGLLVVFALPQLLEEAAALEQFLEAAQGRTDRFPVVDAHPKRHADSFLLPRRAPGRRPKFLTLRITDGA